MRISVRALSGKGLDFAVANAELLTRPQPDRGMLIHKIGYGAPLPPYTTSHFGDEIIDREIIDTIFTVRGEWIATINGRFIERSWAFNSEHQMVHVATGTTRREAAMRCYVAAVLGNVFDMPQEFVP